MDGDVGIDVAGMRATLIWTQRVAGRFKTADPGAYGKQVLEIAYYDLRLFWIIMAATAQNADVAERCEFCVGS